MLGTTSTSRKDTYHIRVLLFKIEPQPTSEVHAFRSLTKPHTPHHQNDKAKHLAMHLILQATQRSNPLLYTRSAMFGAKAETSQPQKSIFHSRFSQEIFCTKNLMKIIDMNSCKSIISCQPTSYVHRPKLQSSLNNIKCCRSYDV